MWTDAKAWNFSHWGDGPSLARGSARVRNPCMTTSQPFVTKNTQNDTRHVRQDTLVDRFQMKVQRNKENQRTQDKSYFLQRAVIVNYLEKFVRDWGSCHYDGKSTKKPSFHLIPCFLFLRGLFFCVSQHVVLSDRTNFIQTRRNQSSWALQVDCAMK